MKLKMIFLIKVNKTINCMIPFMTYKTPSQLAAYLPTLNSALPPGDLVDAFHLSFPFVD